MYLCCLASDSVTLITSGSITIVTGRSAMTAIGDMYNIKFIEFNFSLQGNLKILKLINLLSSVLLRNDHINGINYPSEESKMP